MTYVEKLRHPKWQKKRLEIFERDGFTCTKCGDTETELQVHHLKYTGEPWDAPSENLVTVCKHCHLVFEDFKEITKMHIESNPLIVYNIKTAYENGTVDIESIQEVSAQHVICFYTYNDDLKFQYCINTKKLFRVTDKIKDILKNI